MDHDLEITLSARKYATTYHGEHIGDFKSPETEAARWLKLIAARSTPTRSSLAGTVSRRCADQSAGSPRAP